MGFILVGGTLDHLGSVVKRRFSDVSLSRRAFTNQNRTEPSLGRPAKIIKERIIPGQMKKFFAEVCLMDQPLVTNESITVGEMLGELSAKFGEIIFIKRYHRYEVGK